MPKAIRASVTAGLLLLVVGVFAVATGRTFLFPSLGPSAYLLATKPRAPESHPRRVAGGHLVGIVAGLLAYYVLAPGLVVTSPPPALSPAGVSLAVSGILSVTLTTGGMVVTDLRHAPACATTLIVSLGLLPTLLDALIIVASILCLLASNHALRISGVAPQGDTGERSPAGN
ncbi:HPP family protein [Halorussus halophilus]|uniref:HPP family protein n=1 Tax=Halorussus halophilus TaxID=2650975 RepID=UPI001CE48114|nr:HPP family protein [Halorussus halophilus]